MRRNKLARFGLLLLGALVQFLLVSAVAPDLGTKKEREVGKKIYEKRCGGCHGESGAGDGPAQKFLKPWPRNFAKGIYKFKSTPDDRLPVTSDIMRVISSGNPYTGMPAWPELSEAEVRSVAYYIKSFAEDFANPTSLADEARAHSLSGALYAGCSGGTLF
jgi:mono/diheme cytochrome c family protein